MTRRDLLAQGTVAAGAAVAATEEANAAPARSASRRLRPSGLLKRLLDEAGRIWLVDTHEHLHNEEHRLREQVDLFHWFSHYASSDLVSAGMAPETLREVRDTNRPLAERWARFAPHWENARTTAYGRALLIAARDLHGIEDINPATYRRLSDRIAEGNRPGLYRRVLKEKARIQVSITDVGETDLDRSYFAPAIRFDNFVTPGGRRGVENLERQTGRSITTLQDYLAALDAAMERQREAGMVAVKSGLAYGRTLRYEDTSRAEAERLFEVAMGSPQGQWSWLQPLQDFVMHRVAQNAGELGVPFQIHTGLQEGNGNTITNSNPTGLVGLFFDYPRTRFDLFHGAYPYCAELSTLAKNFQNVYLDMCWLHIISPAVSRRMLDEWIETVPANKILGFGGDYLFVEGAYGHAMMARENVARTLAGKVEEGYLTEDEALALMRKLLRDNAAQLFNLELGSPEA